MVRLSSQKLSLQSRWSLMMRTFVSFGFQDLCLAVGVLTVLADGPFRFLDAALLIHASRLFILRAALCVHACLAFAFLVSVLYFLNLVVRMLISSQGFISVAIISRFCRFCVIFEIVCVISVSFFALIA